LADLYEQHIFYDDVLFPLNFVLINTLKMDKISFWQIMTFDPELASFLPVPASELDLNVINFFSRLFRWQRWENECVRLETTKEISENSDNIVE